MKFTMDLIARWVRHCLGVGLALILGVTATASAQSLASTATVTYPSRATVSGQLADLPSVTPAQAAQGVRVVPAPRPLPSKMSVGQHPRAADTALQTSAGSHLPIQPETSFSGIGFDGAIPPDPNIAVGRNYIVQVVNSEVAVFDKNGGIVAGPSSLSGLWAGLGGPCSTNNAGDPVVQYDALAADGLNDSGTGRWIITQLGSLSAPYWECIAVSATSNPAGSYYLYAYRFGTTLNDYPKFGIWPTSGNSAYLATYNLFANGQSFVGGDLCAYDRDAMLAGNPAPAEICEQTPGGGFLPADLDGSVPPPSGAAGYFLNFDTSSSLRLYQFTPDFNNPNLSTLRAATEIPVAHFSEACGGGTCIQQPNRQRLDSLGDRLMYRLAYRNFGDYEALVVNHSVSAGSSVGVRWYELRSPTSTPGAFTVYQQGTYAPDSAYRWMGSAAMDGAGDIALGYSVSSSSMYPSIAFTGRDPSMPMGTMGAETMLQAGAGAQTNFSRWGDYTSLRIDPSDDSTFWYTDEYYTTNKRNNNYAWSTAIKSFTIASSGSSGGGGSGGGGADFSISAISPNPLSLSRGNSATTSITVAAPNGLASPVTFTIAGLPSKTSASFDPNPLKSAGTDTLTISADAHGPTGAFTLTITGTDNGGSSASTTLTLNLGK